MQVQVDLAVILSIASLISSIFSIIGFVLTQKRLSKTDTQTDAATIAKLVITQGNQGDSIAHMRADIENHTIAIAKRDTEMDGVHKQLGELGKLKIEANFTEVKTELRHIRELLESGPRK